MRAHPITRFVAAALALLPVVCAHMALAEEPPSPPGDNGYLLKVMVGATVGQNFTETFMRIFMERLGTEDVQITPGKPPWSAVFNGIFPDGANRSIAVAFVSNDDAVKQFAEGAADTLILGRRMSHEEKLENAGIANFIAGEGEAVLGLSGAMIVVNPKNPVSQLTYGDLTRILKGRITNWRDLGGPNGQIKLIELPHYPHARNVVLNALHQNLDIAVADIVVPDRAALVDRVAKDPTAFAILFPEIPAVVKTLRLGTEGGLFYAPTDTTLKSGNYGFAYPLYAYYRPRAVTAAVRSFIDSVNSTQTRVGLIVAGLAEPGVVLLSLNADPATPEVYRQQTVNALRLSDTIHFLPGGTEMTEDTGWRLDRIGRFLESIRAEPGKLRLIAFDDGKNSPAEAVEDAAMLGNFVKAELLRRRVKVGNVISLGSIMPLDDDSTVAGRARNRRVEIWIAP